MATKEYDPGDAKARKQLRTFFGPQQVDQHIRQAIQCCWMALPPKKQNVKEVEKLVRRIVDRALRDDADSFGLGRG